MLVVMAGGQGGTGTRRRRGRPDSTLTERWTVVNGVDVFYRESPAPPAAPVLLHVHGFGLSGRYLLPTAEHLAGEFHTLVPDLPGFGRSGRGSDPLDVTALAHTVASFLGRSGRRVRDLGRQLAGLRSHL